MSLFNKDNGSNASGDSDLSLDPSDTTDGSGVEFIPSVPKPQKTVGVSASSLGSTLSDFMSSDNAKKAFTIANALRNGDPTAAASAVAGMENSQLISELFNAAVNVINVIPSADQSPPRGTSGKGFDNSFANANRLSQDMAPTEIRLATGINPNLYSPDYHNSEEGYASPLHVSLINFRFPTVAANNVTTSYINNAIMPDILNRVQSNIGFTLPTGFTGANLVLTMNALCSALELYYSISRLLVYGNDPLNKNEALLYLRGQLNSSVLDEFTMLKRILEGVPIPPNLNTMIFYINQIYLSSDLPGSSAIMTAPHGFPNGAPDWSGLQAARLALVNATSTTVFSVIGKAFPNWYATQPLTGLANPLHDPNFTTIWTNLPFFVSKTSVPTYSAQGPAVSTITADVKYNSWTNNLDGAAFALMSVWKDTATTGWLPGFIVPLQTAVNVNYTTSRISWFTAFGVTTFYSSDESDVCAFARDETYTTSFRFTTNTVSSLQFGSERCFGASARSIQDTSIKLADWLMSFETLPRPGAKFIRAAGGSPKSGPSSKNLSSSKTRKFKGKKPKTEDVYDISPKDEL